MVLRPYRPEDRPAVRRICHQTGYMGDPVDWLWRDRESFADLFSGYWTDREPESATVAEVDGEVAGYLLGCRDSRRVWNPAGLMARHMLRRGLLVRPGTAGVLWRMIGDVCVDGARRQVPVPFLDDRWPAHLHVDLLEVCRGRGVGTALVRRWLARLEDEGVPGCHVETLAENAPAVAFFTAMGFEPHGRPRPVPGFRSPSGARHHVRVLVRSLSSGG